MVRALACIAVVLTHSITNFISIANPDLDGSSKYITFIRFILLAATPIFILISETLISRNYTDGVPKGFLLKRVRFILIPYILVGLFYAFMESGGDTDRFILIMKQTILQGNWHGYFVLVIFQFYLLHILLNRILSKIRPWFPLVLSFVLTFAHQYSFDKIPEYNVWMMDSYPLFHRTFVLAWLFYFVIGFYLGRNYDKVIEFLERSWLVPVAGSFIGYWIIMQHVMSGTYIFVTSNRYDSYLFVVSVFFLMIILFRKIYNTTPMLARLSHFSYFIYLIHLAVIPTLGQVIFEFTASFVPYVLLLSFFTIAVSIGWAVLFYGTRVTKLFTGRIKVLEQPVR